MLTLVYKTSRSVEDKKFTTVTLNVNMIPFLFLILHSHTVYEHIYLTILSLTHSHVYALYEWLSLILSSLLIFLSNEPFVMIFCYECLYACVCVCVSDPFFFGKNTNCEKHGERKNHNRLTYFFLILTLVRKLFVCAYIWCNLIVSRQKKSLFPFKSHASSSTFMCDICEMMLSSF